MAAEDKRTRKFLRDVASFLDTLETTTNRHLDARLALRNYILNFDRDLMRLRDEAMQISGRDSLANRVAVGEGK